MFFSSYVKVCNIVQIGKIKCCKQAGFAGFIAGILVEENEVPVLHFLEIFLITAHKES